MDAKIIIADPDRQYLQRLRRFAFPEETAGEEVLYCANAEELAAAVRENPEALVVAAEEMLEPSKTALYDVPVAVLLGSGVSIRYPEAKKIRKFQKASEFAAQIGEAYQEKEKLVLFEKPKECRILLFSGISGGCGTSAMASACARDLAAEGKKVLYLNLEPLGIAGFYFHAAGGMDPAKLFDDESADPAELFEQAVKTDASGVSYLDSAKNVPANLQLIRRNVHLDLVKKIAQKGLFEYCVVDRPFEYTEDWFAWLDAAYRLILVSDGSNVSNLKVSRTFLGLPKEKFEHKTVLLYNRVCPDNFNELTHLGCPVIGKVEEMPKTGKQELEQEMAKRHMFSENLFFRGGAE